MLINNIKEIFKVNSKQKLLIITIGNILRSDDGIGPFIAKAVGQLPGNIKIYNVDKNPEKMIDAASDFLPDRIVIIDAANFRGKPGEIREIPSELIPDSALSTHTFPLKAIFKIIEEDTGAEIHFIGIQPKIMSMGETMSEEVIKAGETIINIIKDLVL